jgi:hypothetical protein
LGVCQRRGRCRGLGVGRGLRRHGGNIAGGIGGKGGERDHHLKGTLNLTGASGGGACPDLADINGLELAELPLRCLHVELNVVALADADPYPQGRQALRHYVATDVLKRDASSCPIRRGPAAEIENAVIDQLRALQGAPEIVVRTWKAARRYFRGGGVLERFDPLWDELFPAKQARIVQLLVERVDISNDGADIGLRTAGLTSLFADLHASKLDGRRAA